MVAKNFIALCTVKIKLESINLIFQRDFYMHRAAWPTAWRSGGYTLLRLFSIKTVRGWIEWLTAICSVKDSEALEYPGKNIYA